MLKHNKRGHTTVSKINALQHFKYIKNRSTMEKIELYTMEKTVITVELWAEINYYKDSSGI